MNDNDRDINAHSDVRSMFASDLGWPAGWRPEAFDHGNLHLRYLRTEYRRDGDDNGSVSAWYYLDQDNREFIVFND